MKKIKYFLAFLGLILSGCTYNISMANTCGKADDVIDETATNTPNISPNISIPPL